MMHGKEPQPEERGWREPPRRNPPTAIGVATPPPPGRGFRRSWVQRRWTPYRRLAGLSAVQVVAGALLAGCTTPVLLRALGWTLVGTGALLSALLVYVMFLAAPLRLWRESRWLRWRVKRIGRAPRPAA